MISGASAPRFYTRNKYSLSLYICYSFLCVVSVHVDVLGKGCLEILMKLVVDK